MASITSVTAAITLSIADLFPYPQSIQGFSAEDIFNVEPLNPAELQMGLDGILSAGFNYVPVIWSVTLSADSASNYFFDTWYESQKQIRDAYFCDGIVTLNSIGSKWVMNRGILTGYQPMPEAAKVLRPRKYSITFESVSAAPM